MISKQGANIGDLKSSIEFATPPNPEQNFRLQQHEVMVRKQQHSTQECHRRIRGEAGFTLVEILVVLVILGLLGALVGPRVLGYLSSAKSDTARLQVDGISQALDLYRLDSGSYPKTADGLEALIAAPADVKGWNGPYLDSKGVPLDPWGNAYVYKSPGDHGDYDLSTLGADGVPGGDGEASDVTSWKE